MEDLIFKLPFFPFFLFFKNVFSAVMTVFNYIKRIIKTIPFFSQNIMTLMLRYEEDLSCIFFFLMSLFLYSNSATEGNF